MTDRELLELAAKAVRLCDGWQHIFDDYGSCLDGVWDWNPLTNEKDALWLADELQLTIKFHCGLVLVGKQKLLADEASEDYKYAIVRAAAEIGKAMK